MALMRSMFLYLGGRAYGKVIQVFQYKIYKNNKYYKRKEDDNYE